MIAARVVSGIELDTDQIIFAGMDTMFASSRREITEHYPYPILPVHWFSRDAQRGEPYHDYHFNAYSGPHGMRWGHAHPTWTYWALPFLIDLFHERVAAVRHGTQLVKVLKLPTGGSTEPSLRDMLQSGNPSREDRACRDEMWMSEDEDMLNVALWRAKVQKAWCKYDLFPDLFTRAHNMDQDIYHDNKWYPEGIPLVFYSIHGSKEFESTNWLVSLFARCMVPQVRNRFNCATDFENKVWIYEFCKGDSPHAREVQLKDPDKHAAMLCCCVEPRQEKPILWKGNFYANNAETKALVESGVKGRCIVP